MNEPVFVVVFPSIFAKNKKNLLVSNIKKILKIQNQQYSKITTDDDLIIIDANDPVFASSAINLLFGIDRVSIARRVENKFNIVVPSIGKIGANLLLKGETFYVKVEGHSSGYLPQDVEIAGTSSLIEKVVDMECRPGIEQKHDTIIHCYLTGKNAYVSIFLEKGHGGIPYNSQEQQVFCCVYDELSAISCLEAIKQRFDVRVMVCYNTDANLMELVKIINRIIPRMLNQNVETVAAFREAVKKDVEARSQAVYDDKYFVDLIEKIKEGAAIKYHQHTLDHEGANTCSKI